MAGTENEIVIAIEERAAIARLNRPKALNAVTSGMIRELSALLHRCAKDPHIYGIVLEAGGKAFSAGGDIRAIRDVIGNDPVRADAFYAEEYQYNWLLQCFRKRHVALMNGVTMGGGVGVSIFGTHRVAGEAMSFAMPETGIGFFPDIGGSWFLPRMPGMTGMYLGLTGHICGRADAYYAGAVTHCVPAAQFDAVKSAMIEAEPIDAVLDGLHRHPGAGHLEMHREPINRIFSASPVEEILHRLEGEQGEWRGWAQTTLAVLAKKAPLSLKVTHEQLRRGKACKTLKEALVMEYRLATRLIRLPDFPEGIRAAIIDKDQLPRWRPASLGEVSGAYVQSLFEPLPQGDLTLVDYWMPPLHG
jgi:enoyl-CoA hydratase